MPRLPRVCPNLRPNFFDFPLGVFGQIPQINWFGLAFSQTCFLLMHVLLKFLEIGLVSGVVFPMAAIGIVGQNNAFGIIFAFTAGV